MRLREADRDPTKNRLTHLLLGLVAHRQGKHAEAIRHFEQADPNDIYPVHHRALALEAMGRTGEAKELYRKIANFRLNSPTLALVRRDAVARAR